MTFLENDKWSGKNWHFTGHFIGLSRSPQRTCEISELTGLIIIMDFVFHLPFIFHTVLHGHQQNETNIYEPTNAQVELSKY